MQFFPVAFYYVKKFRSVIHKDLLTSNFLSISFYLCSSFATFLVLLLFYFVTCWECSRYYITSERKCWAKVYQFNSFINQPLYLILLNIRHRTANSAIMKMRKKNSNFRNCFNIENNCNTFVAATYQNVRNSLFFARKKRKYSNVVQIFTWCNIENNFSLETLNNLKIEPKRS